MKLSSKVAQLTQIIEPAVTACDVSLWGIEFVPQGNRSLLRIYIEALPEEKTTGKQVSINNCATVTHQISGVLEVHDPIAGEYVLEVSSPGLDRPFFESEQMQDYVGQTISLRLIKAISNDNSSDNNIDQAKRRKVTGKLSQIDDTQLTLQTQEGQTYIVRLDNIDKANLIYQEAL